ncbi:MAG: glycosyltransferase family 2 protein [Crocinitomicaceae bacterium]|nr:glycosyltransferase family 2 protein [Crocinitomicaceae bacterium]
MMNQKALISIITPVFNCENYIEATIDSILNQTYTNWELILVDDCSTDKSVAIIQAKYLQDSRIQLLQNTSNLGAAGSRNNGITASKGKYICFLDSDDFWKPTKLELQQAFQVANNYAFTYTTYQRLKEEQVIGEIKAKPAVTYADLLKTCSIGCSSVMLDTTQFDSIQFPNIRKRQDYALWLKLLKKVDRAYGLDEPLTVYRVRNDSISSNKFKAASYQWHVYFKVEQLGFFSSIYYLMHYTFHGIKNRI